jgi:hypothetical protein
LDDLDFSGIYADKYYLNKKVFRQMMYNFVGEPDNSPRRIKGNGIYITYQYGEDDMG